MINIYLLPDLITETLINLIDCEIIDNSLYETRLQEIILCDCSCIHENRYPVQDDEYNYLCHDSRQVHLVEGIVRPLACIATVPVQNKIFCILARQYYNYAKVRKCLSVYPWFWKTHNLLMKGAFYWCGLVMLIGEGFKIVFLSCFIVIQPFQHRKTKKLEIRLCSWGNCYPVWKKSARTRLW